MEVNETFALQRRSAGVSQARLGRLVGVFPNEICLWERGNRDLRPEQIAALQAALRNEISAKVRKQQELLEQLTA